MFHGLRTKDKIRNEFLAIKTDMSKAYDRLEWSFLESILRQLGFHPYFISCIMWCVTSVSFQVLLNGNPKGYIKPQRGLRQGDPLSPYLFILCTEALTANIRKKEVDKTLTGISVARGSPAISHLLFADDSLFFCKATRPECEVITRLLADYEKVSGQMINYNKSSVVFGNKVPNPIKRELKTVLGIQRDGGVGKYLGIPESISGSKIEAFNYVKEALNGRVTGWSSKLLSKGGKEILLKSVAFALPNHVMSCFRLPQRVITSLNSAVSDFWWGSSGTSKGLHWNSWDSLCTKKQDGGLGFRSLFDFNTVLLAKQLWRLDKYPDSLVARVLRGRYYRNSHPFYATKGYSPSYGWQSLVSAQELILTGTRWQVGSGTDISVWEDSWIPDTDPRPARGEGMEFYPYLQVHELIAENGEEWNIPLLNQLLEPTEVVLVRSLKLRQSLQKDRAIWHYSKSGDYSVKSGYDLLRAHKKAATQQAVVEPSFTALKAHVWTVDCPSKIRHFMWQVLSGAVAVLSNLRKRGVNTDVLCKVCGIEEETINHVLFECAEAKETWNLLHISQTDLSFPTSSIYVNMDFLFSRPYSWKNLMGDTMNNRDIYPWILWYLWKSRNKKTFQGIGWSALEVIQLAERELGAWQVARVSPQILPQPSTPGPPDGGNRLPSTCCLVDGSWTKDAFTSGIGWICRLNGHPNLMGSRGMSRCLSPLHSEFEALLWAMQVILERGIPCSIFLTDCAELQKIIRDPTAWPAFDVYWDIFVERRRRFPSFSLAYIKRESNRQADALARHARDRSVEFSFINMYPPSGVNSMFS